MCINKPIPGAGSPYRYDEAEYLAAHIREAPVWIVPEAALGLPPGVHSYALLPIGYPMGRFGPVRRVALADVAYEDRWGQTYAQRI